MFDFFKKKNRENSDDGQVESSLRDESSNVESLSSKPDGTNIRQVGENDTVVDNQVDGGGAAVTNDQVGENESAGTVEKIDLSDVKGLKAEMQFDEEIEKIKNDKQFLLECYRYLKDHEEELKKLLNVDEIKFDE